MSVCVLERASKILNRYTDFMSEKSGDAKLEGNQLALERHTIAAKSADPA
jgi:hypothetical protein